MMFLSSGRGLKLVFAFTAALSMAACSKNPDDANALGGLGGALARRLHAAADHGHVEVKVALVDGG